MNFIIVTGCSKGLGESISREFLKNKWSVSGISRSRPKIDDTSLFSWHKFDLTDLDNIDSLLSDVFCRVSEPVEKIVLMNNSAQLLPVGLMGTLNSREINHHISLNLTAPMILSNRFINITKNYSQSEKMIINISSGAGKHPYEGWSCYCTSKAGIDMCTKSIALEQGKSGVKTISFAPGIMDTSMQTTIRGFSTSEFPMVDKFKSLKNSGLLSSPDNVAKYIFDHVANQRFNQGVIMDIRN